MLETNFALGTANDRFLIATQTVVIQLQNLTLPSAFAECSSHQLSKVGVSGKYEGLFGSPWGSILRK